MNIEQIIAYDITDKGGVFDLSKAHKKIIYKDVEYTYIATGMVREVFRSVCGNFVIKIPKLAHRIDHNILEFECYRDAPEWCKKHIAVTELTEENYVIQEYLQIFQYNNFFREIGRREDGTLVIFDCDIFLDRQMKKPEFGFRYQQVFIKSKAFGEAYEEAYQIPRRLRKKQKEFVNTYFPNINGQKFVTIGDKVFIDDVLVEYSIAYKCGFTNDSNLDYEFF